MVDNYNRFQHSGGGGNFGRKRRYFDMSGDGGGYNINSIGPHFRDDLPPPPQRNCPSRHFDPEQLPGYGQTNLIVNYIPQSLSDEEFHEIFFPYGKIESLRIVRDRNTGYSFGYGFVKYADPAAASFAISIVNGLRVMNKVLKVSYARPPSDDIKDTNLYITNLPRNTTDFDLVRMFGSFGNIVQKHILYDKYTNLPRGVAFVRYDRREHAHAAIEAMNGFRPPGVDEPIRVRLAENHGKQKANFVAGFQAGFDKRF